MSLNIEYIMSDKLFLTLLNTFLFGMFAMIQKLRAHGYLIATSLHAQFQMFHGQSHRAFPPIYQGPESFLVSKKETVNA